MGKTKNGEPLGLPMAETVFELLKDIGKVRHLHSDAVFPNREGKTRDKSAVSRSFKKACRKAGISDLRFHDLRHDYGSRLVQRGVDIYTVKELMGHKDIKMTMRYAHLSPEKLRSDIRVLDAEIPQKSRKIFACEKGGAEGVFRQNDNVLIYQDRNVLFMGCNLFLKQGGGYGWKGHDQDELKGG